MENQLIKVGSNVLTLVTHPFVLFHYFLFYDFNFIIFVPLFNKGGHSAMALTVGYPAAIATKMLLDGEIQERGVILPFAPDVFMPMLSRLRSEGFTSTYSSRIIN